VKASVLTGYRHLEYMDIATPVPSSTDVLVRVRACGICGSDIHGMAGDSGRRIPPVVMGHEASGDIVGVGREVATWLPGDRVTFDSTIYCGTCRYCAEGLVNLCDDRRVLGVSCADYRRDGAFAEYVVVPQRVLYRLPAEVSYVHGALVEPLAVAVHAVSRVPVSPSSTVVIVGAGIIGLMLLQTLRALGCSRVFVTDINDARLSTAQLLGAAVVVRSDRLDAVKTIREAAGGRGVDVAFEAVGISPTVNLAIDAVQKGGTVVLVGNVAPSVEFPLQSVVTRQISLLASTASCGEYPACIDLLAQNRIDVSGLVSAVAPLSEAAAWFDRLLAGQGDLLKVVLEP
jgi:L-iditol 2-dehydrogenase